MDVATKKPSNNALARDCFKIIFAEIRDNVFGKWLILFSLMYRFVEF